MFAVHRHQTRRLRSALITMIAVVTLAAACTSSGDPEQTGTADTATTAAPGPDTTSAPGTSGDGQPSSTTAAPGTSVELTATARGVTADTIRVGISMLDFPGLVESNLVSQGWGDQQGVWQTYIDDLNARGGINGRMVEPVYTFYSPVGNTEADQACLEMTEDNEVFAVLDGFVGPAEGSNVCIVGPQNTVLVGGVQDAERLAQAQAPWLWPGALRERRTALFVDLLLAEGELSTDDTVAVVAGPQAENDMDNAAEILRDAGIEPAEVILLEAASGDLEAEDANWAVVAERLKTAGVDTVFVVGSTTGSIRNAAAQALGAQLFVLDADELASLPSSVPPESAEGVITINAMEGDELWLHESLQPCIEQIRAAFPDADLKLPSEHADGDEEWYKAIRSYCPRLALFELVARAAGPDLTPETFLAAAETLDEFALPGQPYNSIGPGKYDVYDTFRLSVYDSSVGERGAIVPLTDLVDTTP